MPSSILNVPSSPFLLRREDEKLEAGQVRRIIAAPLSIEASAKLDVHHVRLFLHLAFSLPLSRRIEMKTDCPTIAGRRWMDEKCSDVEF